MDEIRIIRYSSLTGIREGVFFTEETEHDLKAEDVIPKGCILDSDKTFMIQGWDCCFPMDYNLER